MRRFSRAGTQLARLEIAVVPNFQENDRRLSAPALMNADEPNQRTFFVLRYNFQVNNLACHGRA
jgi:hypothetical protein